jgi:hypothetical protein
MVVPGTELGKSTPVVNEQFPGPSRPAARSATIRAMNPLSFIRTLRDERRAIGWKGLLRKRGWKLLLVFFLFYLIRDLILYVIIPVATAAWLLK